MSKSLYQFLLLVIYLEEDEEQNKFILNGGLDLQKIQYYWGTGLCNSNKEMIEEIESQLSKKLRKDEKGWIIPEGQARKINIDLLQKELARLGLKLELVKDTNKELYMGCAISSRLYKKRFSFDIGYLAVDSEEEFKLRIMKLRDELATQFPQSSIVSVYDFVPINHTQLERDLLAIGYKVDLNPVLNF